MSWRLSWQRSRGSRTSCTGSTNQKLKFHFIFLGLEKCFFIILVGMCESWSSRMMTLRGQKEAPWPGSELFSIDTYPLLIYGSRKIFPNWNILSLEDFEGRMNAAIERNAFLESELDEKVGGKKMSFSKRTWPRRTWRWRCRGWKTRPGTWGLSWKSSTLKWWDVSIFFQFFKS